MKFLLFFFISTSVYSQVYKDTSIALIKTNRDLNKYSNYVNIPSNLGENFEDGFYRINYDYTYFISGEVKNKQKVGKWIIQDRYNSNRIIEEQLNIDSIHRRYYTDWGNNGIIYLESEQILYPKIYNLPADYYSNLTDTVHFGYKIKLMKNIKYNVKSKKFESEYYSLNDYRRIGGYKEYFSNGKLKKEACYCIKNLNIYDSTIFSNKTCKEKIFIESLETYSSDGALYGTYSDFFYNSWYENGKPENIATKLKDSIYTIKITSIEKDNSSIDYFYNENDWKYSREVHYDSTHKYLFSKTFHYNSKTHHSEEYESDSFVTEYREYIKNNNRIKERYRKYRNGREAVIERNEFLNLDSFQKLNDSFQYKSISKWSWYDENGKIREEKNYINDSFILGCYNIYYKNEGKLKSTKCIFSDLIDLNSDLLFTNSLCKKKYYWPRQSGGYGLENIFDLNGNYLEEWKEHDHIHFIGYRYNEKQELEKKYYLNRTTYKIDYTKDKNGKIGNW